MAHRLSPALLPRLAAVRGALLAAAALVLCGCAASPMSASAPLPPAAGTANRPDGEGYAGVGELLVRIGVQQGGPSWAQTITDTVSFNQKRERAYVEIRYQGLDNLGRAVFERRDGDALAAAAPNTVLPTTARGTVLAPAAPAAPGGDDNLASGAIAPPATPNTRDIAMDLRLSRQLHIQGKIVEVVEATASGVVFRLY
jgi:hypothetical protein